MGRRGHGTSIGLVWALGASLLGLGACGADDEADQETDAVGPSSGVGLDDAGETQAPESTGSSDGSTAVTTGPTGETTIDPGSDSDDEPASETSEGSGDESTGGELPPPPGLPCERSFRHAGRQGCQSVVEGLEVKFFPLDEPAPVQRLVVFFHGDGGDDYTANWGFREEILDWAIPQDFLVVGVRSPASYDGDTDPSFGAAQPQHADMVASTLEAVVDAYAVVEERALYWGISGGSWFTTSSYIPVAGQRVPGIFVANCGGSGVSFGWAWEPQTDPSTVALNSLYLNYGDQDFLADRAAQSYAEYTDLGFVTDQLVHPGATHCAHPIGEPTLEFWMRELE